MSADTIDNSTSVKTDKAQQFINFKTELFEKGMDFVVKSIKESTLEDSRGEHKVNVEVRERALPILMTKKQAEGLKPFSSVRACFYDKGEKFLNTTDNSKVLEASAGNVYTKHLTTDTSDEIRHVNMAKATGLPIMIYMPK